MISKTDEHRLLDLPIQLNITEILILVTIGKKCVKCFESILIEGSSVCVLGPKETLKGPR